jgi:hypothetical protein
MTSLLLNKSVLILTIKKEWFDLIRKGIKKTEYREIKRVWDKRLGNSQYDYVVFSNGYSRKSPKILAECKSITKGRGTPEWGAEENKEYYCIELGRILEKPDETKENEQLSLF